eukprot:3925616-Amphidinium_carterae.1
MVRKAHATPQQHPFNWSVFSSSTLGGEWKLSNQVERADVRGDVKFGYRYIVADTTPGASAQQVALLRKAVVGTL